MQRAGERVAAAQARLDPSLVAMARASSPSRAPARCDIVFQSHKEVPHVPNTSRAAAPPALSASAAPALVAAGQAVPGEPSRRLHSSRFPAPSTDFRLSKRSGFAASVCCVRRVGSGCGRASCAGGTVTTLAFRPRPGAANGLPQSKRSGCAAGAFRVRRVGSGCDRASCAGGTVTTLAFRSLPGAAGGLPRFKRTPGFAGRQKPIPFPASGLFTGFSE